MLGRIFYIMLIFAGLFSSTQGMALTQPKFRFDLIKRAPSVIPQNGTASATYLVTNQTKITRTLTTVPIQGVTQNTQPSNACRYPFTLVPGASCQLFLNINGAQIPAQVNSGPIVCKTNSVTDLSPDPFLCSQPPQSIQLAFSSSGEQESPVITVSPSSLTLTAESGVTQSYTITNTSSSARALNVQATLPAGWNDVTQDASACTDIAPKGTCALKFTPGNTIHAAEQISIAGTNTNTVTATLAVAGGISVAPTSLSLVAASGMTGTLVVTNSSATVTALAVEATLPANWVDVTQDATDCLSVTPGNSCNLVFTPGNTTYATETVPIQGTNTIAVNVSMTVEQPATATLEVVGPVPLALSRTETPTRTLTVRNISASAAALDVAPVLTGTSLNGNVNVSGACTTPLAAGDSCDIEFTATAIGTVPQTQFNIEGTNTNTVSAYMALNLQIGSFFDGGYVYQLNADEVSGKVVNLTSGEAINQWGGYDQTIAGNISSVTDGAANTAAIVATLGNSQTYAAGLCNAVGVDIGTGNTCSSGPFCASGLYLPAICELVDNVAFGGNCPVDNADIYDAVSSLGVFPLNDFYWSSTGDPENLDTQATAASFANAQPFQQPRNETNSLVACSLAF